MFTRQIDHLRLSLSSDRCGGLVGGCGGGVNCDAATFDVRAQGKVNGLYSHGHLPIVDGLTNTKSLLLMNDSVGAAVIVTGTSAYEKLVEIHREI
tara:strand:+ start:719 stop:1003 length:285 start_codon:yes stop_codon:yes gene_type:complete